MGTLKNQLLYPDQNDSTSKPVVGSDIIESQFFASIADRIAAQAFKVLAAKLASVNEPLASAWGSQASTKWPFHANTSPGSLS